MRRLTVTIILPIIFSVSVCSSASTATYVFQHGQFTEYIFEQTLHILRQYNFFILYSNPEKGKIKTTFKLMDRKGPPDFRVSYSISISEQSNGKRIGVTAEIIAHKDEMKKRMVGNKGPDEKGGEQTRRYLIIKQGYGFAYSPCCEIMRLSYPVLKLQSKRAGDP